MSKITRAETTIAFDPPDQIRVIEASLAMDFQREFIIEVGVAHQSPLTISPGSYDLCRDLMLADVMIFLAKIRTKFNNFTTPFGQINLDGDQLLQEGKDIKLRVITELKHNPPDQYIWTF